MYVYPIDHDFSVDDEVIDRTAEANRWPDVQGRVIEVDGSNVHVQYESGNKRWKMHISLRKRVVPKKNLANDIIERCEREAGCRIDENGFDNFAMSALFGALARETGRSDHEPRDDIAAGGIIRYGRSLEGKAKRRSAETLAHMLDSGMDPAQIHELFGPGRDK